MKQIRIKKISDGHSNMLRAVEFYKEELIVFQKRLEKINSTNPGLEISIQVEHFQNLFIIHKKQIEKITKRLQENLKIISNEIKEPSEDVDELFLLGNIQLNEQFMEEEKLFKDMKIDFNQFTAKCI